MVIRQVGGTRSGASEQADSVNRLSSLYEHTDNRLNKTKEEKRGKVELIWDCRETDAEPGVLVKNNAC